MKIRAMLLTAGTLALLMMGMAAIAPTFGGSAVLAQAPTVAVATPVTIPTPTTTTTTIPMQQDHSGRWGLLGLLGLAGLAELLKRPHIEVRTVETQRVEPTRERTR